MAADLIRLEVWPIRVQLLPALRPGVTWTGVEFEEVTGGSLTRREGLAAAEAWLTGSGGKGEPYLVIHLRNRAAAEPLSRERQQIQRRILDLGDQPKETPFLRVRSIFVSEQTSEDDLIAQILLALLQAGIVGQNLSAGDWLQTYVCRFLSPRARQSPPALQAEIVAIALSGVWKNAGNAEFAGAWRRYVRSWVRGSERAVSPAAGTWEQPDEDVADEDGDPDRHRRQRVEDRGALASHRKYRRDVHYAVPAAGEVKGKRLSVSEVASAVGLSPRQVFRLVKTGAFRPVQQNPLVFDAADVKEWSAQWADRRAARRVRRKALGDLIRSRPGLTIEGARKADYRKRKQEG
jgi:hypothetical protein